jgi:uncharacterized protein YdeI (YjbR/CyaY-like superfamily)
MEVPPDLAETLPAEPKAQAMFEASTARTATRSCIGSRLPNERTRVRRIEQFAAMLARARRSILKRAAARTERDRLRRLAFVSRSDLVG